MTTEMRWPETEMKEPSHPPFEIGGYIVREFRGNDTKNTVTFSFLVETDHPKSVKLQNLLKETGAIEMLKRKGWIDEGGNMLGALSSKQRCAKIGPRIYRLNFFLTREEDKTIH